MHTNAQVIEQVMAWARGRLDEELTVRLLAARAGYALHHFSRMFSAVAGRAPGEWIQGERIALACGLLQETSQRVIDIALACGFKDAATFTRAFRRGTGHTPSGFRAASPRAKVPEILPVSTPSGFVQEHHEEACPAFDLVGLAGESRGEPEVPGRLWAQLCAELDRLGRPRSGLAFRQVAFWSDDAEERFSCVVGFMPPPDFQPPLPWVSLRVPACLCQVFRVFGPPDRLPGAYQEIYGRLLPAMTCRPSGSFAVERYPGSALTEICLPIEGTPCPC